MTRTAFDRLFDDFLLTSNRGAPAYPPHNIVKVSDTHYQIELAVAGFRKDELEIELIDNTLYVKGQTKPKDVEYIHKGIGTRTFERTFALSQDVIVKGADIVHGMLVVDLERIIPEEKLPRKIAIGSNEPHQLNG